MVLALILALVASAVLPSHLLVVSASSSGAGKILAGSVVVQSAHAILQPRQVASQAGAIGSCISSSGILQSGLPASAEPCVVDIAPNEAFNPLGAQHTVTFTCENAAALLNFSSVGSSSAIPAGCYDVHASVTDITNGSAADFVSATCAGIKVPQFTASINCATVQNPICPVGFTPSNSTACVAGTCPAGYILSGTLCHGPPLANGTCPTGTTAVTNSAGSVAYCVAAESFTSSGTNQVVLTINSSTPDVYFIQVTGYVGTTSNGSCPEGTTLVNSVPLTPSAGGPGVITTACQFSVRAEKKYIEATNLTILPIGTCTGQVIARVNNVDFVEPCFFKVKATGRVVLKTNVNCSDGTEPATGTSALQAGFLPDPETNIEPTYECQNGTLAVVNVGVPGINVSLTTNNGSFNPICIPTSRAQALLTTPTPTPSVSPTPTDTPLPTATPIPGTPTATPTPLPTPAPYQQPAACTASSAIPNTLPAQANGVGLAGSTIVDVGASVIAPAVVGSLVYLNGSLALNGTPVAGSTMYGTLHFPTVTTFCDEGITDAAGNATCNRPTGTAGRDGAEFIPTDISFVTNCQEYGFHTYFVTPNGTPPTPGISPPSASHVFPDPFCVIPTAFGILSVSATFTSNINTQPSLTTGSVTLTQAAEAGTPSPTPATPLPTSTNTPVPTETSTPTPTPNPVAAATATATPTPVPPTSTPTATPTPTATATPTAVPVLRFSLDAARVTRPKLESKRQGIDQLTHGEKVSLVMYYTIKSMPKAVRRVTRYQIKDVSGRVVFDVPFPPGTESHTGQLARYTSYTVSSALPFGVYTYRAVLTLGKQTQTRTWMFAVVRGPEVVAGTIRFQAY